ncbi:gliding motility-associated C-terminal domain-containing protein [Parapedobacter sp. 10938]|uniref:gliding motility-associated C-terminal domain-containing protein n=1 Tax=Parapedobacter flavus TaxID=3110225 RepID=UPI002DB8F893|nr:gliding motility-associated C-terminal domain-containing protein [Parapedobacter sp. 10938]MEC3880070.1 gliding motility-associated C-terminal domain-containing protein [Parapedobacter sp. 10938]
MKSTALLFVACCFAVSLHAQLSLHVEEQFFAGYSKPFTDISSRMADTPVFTFDYPDTVALCNQPAFHLEVTDVQLGYRYQWYRNGEVIADQTAPIFEVTTDGTYAVGVSAGGNNFVHSDSVTVLFQQLERPRTTDNNIAVCEGKIRTLTLSGYPQEAVKRWYRNNVLIPDQSETTLQVSTPGSYRVEISIGTCSVSSDELIVSFVEPPVALIQAASDEPICVGTSHVLTATHPADGTYSYQWSTGETTQSIAVSNGGIYTLILTNAGGCADTAEIEVRAYEQLVPPQMADTVICVAEQQVVRLEAPPGYMAYYWNGATTSSPYLDVSAPGTYSLQVADENGCRVSTTVEVRPYCEALTVPNMFSPNGDGVADKWEISGLEERDAMVTVFDRNGQTVFRSHGYNMPWDGSSKVRLVPVGAYYYLIIVGGEQYRGPLTVLY